MGDLMIGEQPAEATAITHPEEMRGGVTLRFGDRLLLQAGGRVTPAGVIATGLSIAAVVASAGLVVWASRKPFKPAS